MTNAILSVEVSKDSNGGHDNGASQDKEKAGSDMCIPQPPDGSPELFRKMVEDSRVMAGDEHGDGNGLKVVKEDVTVTVSRDSEDKASAASFDQSKLQLDDDDGKDIYRKLVEESPYVPGDENALVPIEEIRWLDMTKIQEGLDFFQDYFSLYCIVAVMGMVSISLAVKRISTVIFRSEGALDPRLFFRRFFGKLMGVRKFFAVLLTPDEARKLFFKVRKLHAIAAGRHQKIGNGVALPKVLVWKEEPWMGELATAVRKDMEQIPTNPETNKCLPHLSWDINTPISQFDIVYLTTSFFGPVWMKPHLYGMSGQDDPKMKSFIHVWAVIDRLLGVRDEFNIYINPNKEVINRVVNEVYVTSVKEMDAVLVHLQNVTVRGIRHHVNLFTQKSIVCLALQMLGCETVDNVWKVMSFRDKFWYRFLQTVFWSMSNISLVRMLMNVVFEGWLHHTHDKCSHAARKKW